MKTLCFSLAIMVLPFFSVFSSCNKDEEKQTDPQYVINGVELYDSQALPTGSIGSPDNRMQAEGAELIAYPIPCRTRLHTIVQIVNQEPVTVETTLIHVLYPEAPSSYKYADKDEPIPIENKNSAGEVALSSTRDLEAAPAGQNLNVSLDVAALPRGFYKLVVEVSDGRKLHMATFIQ